MGPLGKAKRTIEEFIKVIFLNEHGKYISKLSEKQQQIEFDLFQDTYIDRIINDILEEVSTDILKNLTNSIEDITQDEDLLKELKKYKSQKNKGLNKN